MEQQIITVTVKKGGALEYKVQGVKGASCTELSKVLDNMGEVTRVELTSEYYEDDPNNLIIEDIKL